MQGGSWFLVGFLLCLWGSAEGWRCWNTKHCDNLNSQERMDCLRRCRANEVVHHSYEKHSSSEEVHEHKYQRRNERPPYSMEHFRWGKPTGRKRRPIKVYTSHESHEVPYRKRYSSEEWVYKHKRKPKFHWTRTHKGKRYGGFINHHHKHPLFSLLHHTIGH